MAVRLELSDALAWYEYVVFDTTVLIDAFRAQRVAAERTVERTPVAQRRTSVVSMWEFLRSKEGPFEREPRRAREDWLDKRQIVVLDIGAGTSFTFRAALRLDESPNGLADALIAAECIARRVPLVTSNAKDFLRVSDLRLVVVN